METDLTVRAYLDPKVLMSSDRHTCQLPSSLIVPQMMTGGSLLARRDRFAFSGTLLSRDILSPQHPFLKVMR
jgi:hypothetical protein